jgi:hypothetical protein
MAEKATVTGADVEGAQPGSPESTSTPTLAEKARQISREIQDSRPSLWTPHMFRLYSVLALGYLCIVLQGYDGSLMAGINAMASLLQRRLYLAYHCHSGSSIR